MKENHKDYIKEVTVKNLFGYYTYKIPVEKVDIHSQLMILYGDNGSGKTTILEIIYYLLSLSHKNKKGIEKLLHLKFETITIVLQSNHVIKINKRRITDKVFQLSIANNKNFINPIAFDIIQEKWRFTKNQKKILKYIQKLKITAFYLSDDRKFFSNENTRIDTHIHKLRGDLYEEYMYKYGNKKSGDKLLKSAIQNVEDWIEKKALQGSRQGEINTNAIYKEIVKRITKSNATGYNLFRVKNIERELESIIQESNKYAKYGLMSSLKLEDMITAVISLQGTKKEILYSIIQPYIKGLRANLNSLKEVQKLILSLIENINSYLHHKEITYHLSSGFKIIHKGSGEKIPLTALSSGERQLLLLICNVITASEEATIFIIDEPEISLNVKWQRNLLDTLLEFGKNRNIQFIIATHSIELLTGHSDSIVKLINHQPQIQQGNAR